VHLKLVVEISSNAFPSLAIMKTTFITIEGLSQHDNSAETHINTCLNCITRVAESQHLVTIDDSIRADNRECSLVFTGNSGSMACHDWLHISEPTLTKSVTDNDISKIKIRSKFI